MPNTPPFLKAGGDIYPCRFVKLSAAADHTGLQAGDNEASIGVSMEGSNYPPLSDLVSTTKAAEDGEYFRLFGDGDQCLLEIGLAVTRGQRLKPDANGRGVPVATTGTTLQNVGAVALASGTASGEKIPVQVLCMRDTRPALV